MKITLKYLGIIAALAATLLCSTANATNPVRYGTFYYEDQGSINCGNNVTSCRLDFAQTPSDKLVMIKKINCLVTASPVPEHGIFGVATTPGGLLSRYRWLPIGQVGAANQYVVIVETELLIGLSRFPVLSFSLLNAGSLSLDCSLVGELLDP